MTWSYSMDPSASDKDAVRYLCGDTCFEDQQLTDEEIGWILTEESNVYFAAGQACGSIAAMYARRADRSVGDLRISYKSIMEQYKDRQATLDARGGTRAAMPYAGGISKSDKETVEETEDRVQPFAEIGIHDAPGAVYTWGGTAEDEL